MFWPAALWVCVLQGAQARAWSGDPDGPRLLEADLQGALRSTERFGPMPAGSWTVYLHTSDANFEKVSGAPPQRFAAWIGDTLHLRPFEKLRRRDASSILRHELVHRRLAGMKLRAWEEEARCLFAEGHSRPPEVWPTAPDAALQDKLDLALRRGTTKSQAWAYAWLRAWTTGNPLPMPLKRSAPKVEDWKPEPKTSNRSASEVIQIRGSSVGHFEPIQEAPCATKQTFESSSPSTNPLAGVMSRPSSITCLKMWCGFM